MTLGQIGVFSLTAPQISDFTWVNQGDTTYAQGDRVLYLCAPSVETSRSLHILKKAAPTAPYEFMVAFRMINVVGAFGPILRDSSSGYIQAFGATNPSTLDRQFSIGNFTSPTATGAGAPGSPVSTWPTISDILAMRIRVTAGSPGTRYFDISVDGINWLEHWSCDNNNYIVPDEIGFHITSYSSNGIPAVISLFSFSPASEPVVASNERWPLFRGIMRGIGRGI